MRRFAAVLLAVAFLCSLTARATQGAEMAGAVPSDALVYIECSGDAAQAVLPMAALPPVAGMMMPQAANPFGYLDQLLHLPAGTAAEAAPHVTGAALAIREDGPLFVVALDEDAWPDRLLQGQDRSGPDGLVTLSGRNTVATTRGNLLLLGTRDACAAIPASAQNSLAASAAYADARAKAEGASVLAFAALPPLLDALRKDMPNRQRDGFNAFTWISGLDKADYVVAAASGRDATRLTLHFSDESARLLQLMPQTPMRTAAEAPADAALTVVLNWGDAAAFVGKLRDMVTQMAATAGGGGGPDPFAAIEAVLGMPLNQFAATLGSGAAAYLSAGADAPMIGRHDWTAVLPLRDAAGFRTALDSLARNAIGGPLPSIESNGRSMMQFPRAPVFLVVTDDALVVSGSPENLAACLDWRGKQGRASLAERAGDLPLAVLIRADLGRLLTSYPAATSGTKMVLTLGRDGVDLNLALSVEDVDLQQLQYLSGYSAMMAAMLMPALARARTEARKTVGMSDLHNIGLGLAMYRNDDDGKYPDSLAELVDRGYLADASPLIDPNDPDPQPLAGGKYKTSFEFVGALPPQVPPDTIIAYSRKGVYPQGRNVLYVDNAVMYVSEWQLQQPGEPRTSLQASYDGVVAAYGNDLTPEIDARLRKFYEIAG